MQQALKDASQIVQMERMLTILHDSVYLLALSIQILMRIIQQTSA